MRLLDMLKAGGFDIAEYLNNERQRHFNARWGPDLELENRNGRRRILHVSYKDPFSLFWDWWVDPSGSAFEALREFRLFGPPYHFCLEGYHYPEDTFNWRYFYPAWCCRSDVPNTKEANEKRERFEELL